MRCRSDRANGLLCCASSMSDLSDSVVQQEYLTATMSPARTTRPDPSTIVVLETPDGGEEEGTDDADDDAAEEELSAAVDERFDDDDADDDVRTLLIVVGARNDRTDGTT